MDTATGIVNTTLILHLLLPAGAVLVGLLMLLYLAFDWWRARRRDTQRLQAPDANVEASDAEHDWQRRPRLTSLHHVLGIAAVGVAAAGYLSVRGIPVLALFALAGAGIAVWMWRGRLHSRWDRELDRQTFLLIRHLRNKLQQGVTLLIALEQTHEQEYMLAPPLRDEMGLLLRRANAGETLGEVLSTSAESPRYAGTHIYRRLLFHLGQATEDYMGPAKMADLLDTFLEVATLVRDTQRTLEARIAQAKYSRWIVAGLLPLVVAFILWRAPEFGTFLLHRLAGNIALGIAALLAALSFVIGKKLATLEPLRF